MRATADIPSEAVRHYCRTARRLRHRLRHSPTALHASLRTLRPVTPVPVRTVPHQPTVFDAPAAERFALLVRYSLVGSLLPYSTRQALLRKAARMGIRRFDANLIIASVQHRAGGTTLTPEPTEASGKWVWAVVIGVQIAIALGAFCLLRL